jgi:hypothetical protein
MKRFLSPLLFLFVSAWQIAFAQPSPTDRVKFFSDTSTINATIITNTNKLFKNNKQGVILPATIVTTLPDGTNVNEEIQLEIRGHFRHDYCYVPPLKLIFKKDKPSILSSLKSLKLVNECKLSREYDQYLMKEFVIYKMYNLLTDMSFRVRWLNVTFQDSSGKKKPITERAFLLEDIKEVAKRNNCGEWRRGNLVTEATDRKQMTMVAIFEFMIGNTDWAVPVNHNTKLIYSLKDSLLRPLVVPYDFDYSGFVNTEYAVPDDRLGIENVQQRLYRGYARTMEELNVALDVFKKQKENIYGIVKNFDLLTPASKREVTVYLDAFYDLIKNPKDVKNAFIENARTQ